MTIRFHPPQLQAARQSSAFLRVAAEMLSPEVPAELRVLQQYPATNTRVVFIKEGRASGSLDLPRNWLYSEVSEEEMRQQLRALLEQPGSRS